MVNHACQFDWCTNGALRVGVDFEHMSDVAMIPATGTMPGSEQGEVLVSLWYQEDLDLAPTLQIEVGSGGAADLRIAEAVILHAHLGRLIQLAIAGTNFDPDRIIEYLGGIK